MPHRIHIMTQNDIGSGVAIGKNELIVELKNKLCRIERAGSALMHGKMDESLVGEETRWSGQLSEALQGQRPIGLLGDQKHSGIDRISSLALAAQQALIARELTITQVKGGRCSKVNQLARAGKKQDIGIEIESGPLLWE